MAGPHVDMQSNVAALLQVEKDDTDAPHHASKHATVNHHTAPAWRELGARTAVLPAAVVGSTACCAASAPETAAVDAQQLLLPVLPPHVAVLQG